MTLSLESTVPTAADAPSTFPTGLSVYNINDEGGWPADFGVLHVSKGNATNGSTQRLLTSGRVFVRGTTGSTWGAWHEVDRTAV